MNMDAPLSIHLQKDLLSRICLLYVYLFVNRYVSHKLVAKKYLYIKIHYNYDNLKTILVTFLNMEVLQFPQ